jgi:AmmeMemoRadiSam system protein A
MIGWEVERLLLRLARQALEARVCGTAPPDVSEDIVRLVPYGVFVSIHRDGELRGCLGALESRTPLYVTVADLGAAVADSDPRFSPLTSTELEVTEIEISLLARPREITSTNDILIGRHGLIVQRDDRRGLFLPCVPVDHGWAADAYVARVCEKAGLPPDAWKHGARISVFEAHVFCESAHDQAYR